MMLFQTLQHGYLLFFLMFREANPIYLHLAH